MATDLPDEEFGYGAPRNRENAAVRPPPPDDSEAWVKYWELMSDESRTPPKPEDEWRVPDWLAEEHEAAGEAEVLADEEERASGARPLLRGASAVGLGVPRRRYIYRSSESTRVSHRVYRIRVTIVSAAGHFNGQAEGPEIPAVRAEIAARATLDALNKGERERVALALRGARVLRIFESPIVVVGVYGLNTGETTPLLGACLVHNSVEQASILATLQAADRWLAWQARKPR